MFLYYVMFLSKWTRNTLVVAKINRCSKFGFRKNFISKMDQMAIHELQEVTSSKLDAAAIREIIEVQSGLTDVQIIDINISTAAMKGDAYLSIVNRITFQAEGTTPSGENTLVTIPVIVKSMPSNIGRRITFRSRDFFENEIIFYKKVWPVMNNFQTSKNVERPFTNVPVLLSALEDGENDYIALEDLSYKGFQSVTRSGNVDYSHAAHIMKLFGRFHALAYAFKQQDAQRFEEAALELKETYFAEKYRSWFTTYQNKLIDIAKDAIKKELPDAYVNKFNNFCDKDIYGLLCEFAQVRGPLSVITHGDAWLPNFLHKYDSEGVLLDAVMVDFQLTRYTTCVNDIVFFLYVCLDGPMRTEHWDHLVVEYHTAFTDFVGNLGGDPSMVSLDTINTEIKKYGSFALGMGLEAIIISMLDEDQVSNLDDIEGDEAVPIESICILYPLDTPEKRKRLADVVKHAVDNGFI